MDDRLVDLSTGQYVGNSTFTDSYQCHLSNRRYECTFIIVCFQQYRINIWDRTLIDELGEYRSRQKDRFKSPFLYRTIDSLTDIGLVFSQCHFVFFMPNVAVCALLCPIAISMFKSIGYDMHMRNDSINIVLLCIGWGAGIGGVGSPLGGAMNITAISYLNDFTQQEFMYIDWVIRMIPYLVIVMAVLSIVMIRIGKDCDPIKGSKAYFNELLQHLPPMHRDEKISLVLFVLAVVLAFVRPLYADFFIGLEPAYVFLIIGALLFFLRRENGQPFLTMKQVEKESLWGMMMLFGGGMALGTLVNESQAAGFIVDLFLNIPIHNMFLLVVIIFVIAALLSEVTNSTVCAAILTSIVLHTTSSMGFSPIPFWFGLCIAMNAEFLLPISVRAIPVSYGLDPGS